MRKTLLLALREYKAAVRSKAFMVLVALMPVMMGGGAVAMKLLEGQVDTTDKHIAVVDRSGLLADALERAAAARNATEVHDETGKKVRPGYIVHSVPPNATDPDAQRLELSGRVRRNELHAFVEIGPTVLNPEEDVQAAYVRYHAHNTAFDDTRRWLGDAANRCLRSLRLAEAGLDETTVTRLTRPVPVEALGLLSRDELTGQIREAERSDKGRAIFLPMGLMMLMFMLIALAATPLINAVLEEKMQRIAEVLLGSVRPFQVMLGKLLGSVGISLTVMALYAGGAIAAAYYAGKADQIPFYILPWFGVYQVAAILMFGALFAAMGAACNDLKEAQSLMMPVWLIVMIPMFVWIQVLKEPLSSFATWMSLIPPCTPMLMLVRQTTPAGIPAWQPWVGLVGVVVFTALCVWLAGRIFRVGILMQGKPPKLGELARWAIRG